MAWQIEGLTGQHFGKALQVRPHGSVLCLAQHTKNTTVQRMRMLITISNIHDTGQACKEMSEGLQKCTVMDQDKA